MDLISIARRYRIIKKSIVSVFILILLIYLFIILLNISAENKERKIFESYTKLANNLASKYIEINQTMQPIDEKQLIQNIKNIYKQETKQVFLTFDDGPSKQVTIPILDLLKQENIKATFFVLGSRVELYPEIIKREYEEGHYIANHGYSHTYTQIYNSPNSVLEEYQKTNEAIKNALQNSNYDTHIFRFPGGSNGGIYKDLKNEAKQLLEDNNIATVDWNALIGDTEGINTVEGLINRLKQTVGTKTSVVVLMHDAGNKQNTYAVLPQVIEYFRQNGYEFKNFYDIIK